MLCAYSTPDQRWKKILLYTSYIFSLGLLEFKLWNNLYQNGSRGCFGSGHNITFAGQQWDFTFRLCILGEKRLLTSFLPHSNLLLVLVQRVELVCVPSTRYANTTGWNKTYSCVVRYGTVCTSVSPGLSPQRIMQSSEMGPSREGAKQTIVHCSLASGRMQNDIYLADMCDMCAVLLPVQYIPMSCQY